MLEVQHTPGHELNISYIDDTILLQSSVSITRAIRSLQEHSEYQLARGRHLGLTVSPSKSELLHRLPLTSKDKTTVLSYHPPLPIVDHTIPPSRSLKYLGIHIDESLTFKKHAITAASLGKSSLGALLFLWHQANGIPVYIARYLTLTVLLPKMLWVSPAWWTGNESILYPLSVTYHSMARWITGLPPSMRICNLLTCAYLPPLNIYLDYLSSKFAIRLLFLLAGYSLSGLPLTPHCPSSAPGTSPQKHLIKDLM
jgi:hypothetical protein